MIRTATISSQSELEETWVDPNFPEMVFQFKESSLEDCEIDTKGNYIATYETFEVTPTSYTQVYNSETNITYTLPLGEYGIKPS